MLGWQIGKKRIFIKTITFIMVQVFFVTSLGYSGPESNKNLRMPMGSGYKKSGRFVAVLLGGVAKDRPLSLRDFKIIDAKYFDWHRDSVVAAEASQYLDRQGNSRLRRLNEALDVLKTGPSGKDKLFSVSELKEATQDGFQLYKGNLLGAANHDNIPGLNLALFYSKSSMDISAYTRAFFMAHEFSHALGRDEKVSYEIMVRFLVRYGKDVASFIRDNVDKEMRGVGGPDAKNLMLELIDAVLKELTNTSDEAIIIKAAQLQIFTLVEKSEQLRTDLDDKHRYVATQVKTTKGKQRLLEFSKLCKTGGNAYQEDSGLVRGIVIAMLKEGLSGMVELREIMDTPHIAEQLTRIINVEINSYVSNIEEITLKSELLVFFQILQIFNTLTSDTRGRALKKVKKYIRSCPQNELFLLLYEDMPSDIKTFTMEVLNNILKKLKLLDLLDLYQDYTGIAQRELLITVIESYDFQRDSLNYLRIYLDYPVLQKPELERIRAKIAQQIEIILQELSRKIEKFDLIELSNMFDERQDVQVFQMMLIRARTLITSLQDLLSVSQNRRAIENSRVKNMLLDRARELCLKATLQQLLDYIDASSLNPEGFDGFITALVCSEKEVRLNSFTLLADLRALKDPTISISAREALNTQVARLKSSADIDQLVEQLAHVGRQETAIKKELMECLIEKASALKTVREFSEWFDDPRVQGETKICLQQALDKKLKDVDLDGVNKYFQDPRIKSSLRAYLEEKARLLIEDAFPYLKAVAIELRNPRYQDPIRRLILARGYELIPAKDEFFKLAARLKDRALVPELDSEEEIAVRIVTMATDMIRSASLLQICQWRSHESLKPYTRMSYLLDKELKARAMKINTYQDWTNIFTLIKQGGIKYPAAHTFRELFSSRIEELGLEEVTQYLEYFASLELPEEASIKVKLTARKAKLIRVAPFYPAVGPGTWAMDDGVVNDGSNGAQKKTQSYWQDFDQRNFGPLVRRQNAGEVQLFPQSPIRGRYQYVIRLKKGDEIICPVKDAKVLDRIETALVIDCGGDRRLTLRGFTPLAFNINKRLWQGAVMGKVEKDTEMTIIFWHDAGGIAIENSIGGMENWITVISVPRTGGTILSATAGASQVQVLELAEDIKNAHPGEDVVLFAATRVTAAPQRDHHDDKMAISPASDLSADSEVSLEGLLESLEKAVNRNDWDDAIEIADNALTVAELDELEHAKCANFIGKYFIPQIIRLCQTSGDQYYVPFTLFMSKLRIKSELTRKLSKIILVLASIHKMYLFKILTNYMIMPITDDMIKDAVSLADAWRKAAMPVPESFNIVLARYNNLLRTHDKPIVKGVQFLYFFMIWKKAVNIFFDNKPPIDWQNFMKSIEIELKRYLETGKLAGQTAVLPRELIEMAEEMPAVEQKDGLQIKIEKLRQASSKDKPIERPGAYFTLAGLIQNAEGFLDKYGPDKKGLERVLGLNVERFRTRINVNHKKRRAYPIRMPHVISSPFYMGPTQIEILFSVLHNAWLNAMDGDLSKANYIAVAADMLWQSGRLFDTDSNKRYAQIVELITSVNMSKESQWFHDCICYMYMRLIAKIKTDPSISGYTLQELAGLINRTAAYIGHLDIHDRFLQGNRSSEQRDFDFGVYVTMAHQTAVSVLSESYIENLRNKGESHAVVSTEEIISRAQEWLTKDAGRQFKEISSTEMNNPEKLFLEEPVSIWRNNLIKELQARDVFKEAKEVNCKQLIFVDRESNMALTFGGLAIVGDTAYLKPVFSWDLKADLKAETKKILAVLANNQIVVKQIVILPAVYSFIRESAHVNTSM